MNLQIVFESVVQLHDGCLVTTSVAIVRSTEYRHYVLIMTPVVSLMIFVVNDNNL